MRTAITSTTRLRLIILLAVLAFATLAPGAALPAPAASGRAEAADYFPLRKGDRWNYVSAADGAAIVPVRFTTRVEAVRRGGRTGPLWYRLRNYQGSHHWVRQAGGRVTELPDRLWYQFDVAEGIEWTMSIRGGVVGSDGATLTIGSRSEVVQVPAGVFNNCIRIDYRHGVADAGVTSEWFARGVGLVKRAESRIFGAWITRLESAVVNGRRYPARR